MPLAATHHLRNSINTGKAVPREILERYEIPIVASVLKLYLLELPGIYSRKPTKLMKHFPLITFPDSLVSSQVYEIIKTIYSSPESATSAEARVSVLQNTLGQLRLANIATLDAITTHFTRLIELTSADETFVASLAQTLAPCILRPRVDNALTMHERHSYRMIRDLFDHKEEIFGELKRASSQNHGVGAPPTHRQRAPSSTDESNRRANMEARNQAIVSRARAPSPSPSAAINGRGHRRDRSSGAAERRFPIQTSPPANMDIHKRGMRHSLEVPDENSDHGVVADVPSTLSKAVAQEAVQEPPTANGSADHAPYARTSAMPLDEIRDEGNAGVEKKNSLGRSGHVAATANRLNRKQQSSSSASGLGMIARHAVKRDSVGSLSEQSRPSEGDRVYGVELSDKPMMDY